MNKLDELITKLTEVKEELNKNMNQSYGSQAPNSVTPDTEFIAAKTAAPGMSVGFGQSEKDGDDNSDQNGKAPILKSPKGVGHRDQPKMKKQESPEEVDRQMRSVAEKGEAGPKDIGNGKYVVGKSPSPEQENKEILSNMAAKADTVRPDAGFGSVTVKDTTTPKASNPAKPFGTVTVKSEGGEYFSLFKNGQWDISKGDAEAAPPVHMVNVKKMDEPHEDDPKHEEKEVKIAGKIKSEAKDLLDMHKKDDIKGVHKPISAAPHEQGKSWAGMKATYHSTGNDEWKRTAPDAKYFADSARQEHKDKLSELKSMPKPKLTKSENVADEIIEKLNKAIPPYKIKAHATQLAGSGPITPKHMSQAKANLESQASKKPAAAPAAKVDRTKVPVKHITSYKAVSGHGYEATHHHPDGTKTAGDNKSIAGTDVRMKNPKMTHTIHLKEHEPIHTDEATAHSALKQGHFNVDAHLSPKPPMKKSYEETVEMLEQLYKAGSSFNVTDAGTKDNGPGGTDRSKYKISDGTKHIATVHIGHEGPHSIKIHDSAHEKNSDKFHQMAIDHHRSLGRRNDYDQ
jgi:hypothetical protein